MAQLTDILPYLDVEPLEAHLFRGQNDASTPHVFGGQVLAQAISAAYHTVAGDQMQIAVAGITRHPSTNR